MSELKFNAVHRKFNAQKHVVRGANLLCNEGEYICLLGPSGCGKTTMLRMAAGLDHPDQGDILIGGNSALNMNPFERKVGLAFQNYALYPHLSVRENMAFPLKAPIRNEEFSYTEIDGMVRETSNALKIEFLLDRQVHELSGGQQQRVALGRALVRRPSVLLLDEPITHLDARLRYEMRAELKRLHKSRGTTTLHVTHDQQEALALADRIAIMRNGVIEQIGKPLEIYNNPATDFVAAFVGDPPMSLLNATIDRSKGGAIVKIGDTELVADFLTQSEFNGSKIKIGFRSSSMSLISEKQSSSVLGTIFSRERTGREIELAVDTDAGRIRLRLPPSQFSGNDEVVHIALNINAAYFFDEDGNRIRK